MIDSKKIAKSELVSRLCNLMVNTQDLIEDLEFMREKGLARNQLKQTAGRFQDECEKAIAGIFGAGYKDVQAKEKELKLAIREKKDAAVILDLNRQITDLKERDNIANKEILFVYDKSIEAKRYYNDLSLDERFTLTKLIEKLREGKVEFKRVRAHIKE